MMTMMMMMMMMMMTVYGTRLDQTLVVSQRIRLLAFCCRRAAGRAVILGRRTRLLWSGAQNAHIACTSVHFLEKPRSFAKTGSGQQYGNLDGVLCRGWPQRAIWCAVSKKRWSRRGHAGHTNASARKTRCAVIIHSHKSNATH
jgi:hypothetical protein